MCPEQQSKHTLKVALVAGETSGDILGAGLMKALKERHSDVQFIGVGGPLMAEEGLQSLFPMETLAVMGIVDVLLSLPSLLKARRQVIQTCLHEQPHIFIGIDAPDFNLPIEQKLKKHGIITAHYVSPSVWAWRPKRIFKIKQAVDDVFGILPFEQEFYQRYDAPLTFVGHPLADRIPLEPNQKQARQSLGLDTEKTYVAVMPGSRGGEVALLMPTFIQAAEVIRQRHPDVEFLLAFANDARKKQIQTYLQQHKSPVIELFHFFDGQIDGRSRQVMEAANSCILTSGTISLEAMLLKRPQVVCYRFKTLNYHILKYFVSLQYFSLPNLLANDALIVELLQQEVTAENIATEVTRHLTTDMSPVIQRYYELHRLIRCNASQQVAQRVLDLTL